MTNDQAKKPAATDQRGPLATDANRAKANAAAVAALFPSEKAAGVKTEIKKA